jgi:hypothetical protein
MPMPEKPSSGQRKFDKDWFVNLWEAVQTCMLTGDGKTTRVQRCWGSGTTIQSIQQPSSNRGGGAAAVEYEGYFTVIDVSDDDGQKIKIVDGFSDDLTAETSAGIAVINNTQFQVDAATLTIGGNAYVYLESVYDDVLLEPGEPEIVQYSSIQAQEDGVARVLISRVKWNNDSSTIQKYSQESHGMIQGFCWGSCDE